MRVKLALASAAFFILLAILVIRAEIVFTDTQIEPAKLGSELVIDEDGAIQRFSTALTYSTISYDDRSQFDAGEFLKFHRFLQESYPLVHQSLERTVVNEYSLVYHLRGSDDQLKPVLYMAHMDVVPIDPYTSNQWTHEPFSGDLDNGSIWGRGALDDKIGVISLLEAMELLLSENPQPDRSIYLAFGHDEEVGGLDGAQKIAEYFAARNIEFEFVLDEGGAVTRGVIPDIDQPVAVIGVAEKGWVNLELIVNAPGGHSSQPPEHTAVGILSEAIVKIENVPFPANIEFTLMTSRAIGTELPFIKRLILGNSWLFSPLIKRVLLKTPEDAAGVRTSTAATMISGSPKSNILPTRATAVVNFRIMPGESVDSVRDRVKRIVDNERVEISVQTGWEPSRVSPVNSDSYKLIAGTIRAFDQDILVAPYMVRGGTDSRYFQELSPNIYRFSMVGYNPDTIQYVHGINEHIPVDEFFDAIEFYYLMIRQSTDHISK